MAPFSPSIHWGERHKVPFTVPEYFQCFLDDGWKLGTAHILCRDGKCLFLDGKAVMDKRDRFRKVRAGLQSKGIKSAKRVLKRISGRENRWMADVNHRASKTAGGL